MNAQELTEEYYVDHKRISDLEKQVKHLNQTIELMRLHLNDMRIDIIMLQDEVRTRNDK